MSIELRGPMGTGEKGGCSACGYPPFQNLDSLQRKPGKVFELRVTPEDQNSSQSLRLCKGCLWKLREQMKGVIR